MGVTLERVQNKFACIIGELCSEPLLLSQFAIWVDLRISEYKSKGTISLDCSGTTPDPSWLKGHVVQPLAAASSSDNGRARSGSANIRNSLPHKSIHSSRDPGHGSNYSSNNRTDGNVDNSDVGSDRLSPDIQLIKQESDSAFPVSLHQHSARKRQSEDDLSQGENFYEDSSFSTPKVRRVDSAADETSAVDSPSNQSFMSVIGDSLQDNDDVSDNSLMMAGEDQSKGGNQSFTPRAGTSFSMPSASATPGTSSSAVPEVKKMVMSKVVDSPNTAGGLPFIDWQTATPTQHDQAWFIGRQSKRNIRARVVMCDDKAESTIRGMVNVVGILERFLQVRFNDFRRCEIIPPTELDAYLVSFFLELRKPDGRDYDPYSLSNLRSYLDRFLREHNYPYSIGVSALFTASQQAFTRKRRSLLAVRSSQKELELQVEQSLFGSPLKAGSMEVEPWKLLYTPPTADILKKMTNQAWIDAGKVEQGGKTSKSKPTESAVSSAGESAKESSAIGDTSFTNQTEQKESPSSAALKDNGQRLGGNLQGLDSSSSLASIANLTATLTQSKSQSTGDQNV